MEHELHPQGPPSSVEDATDPWRYGWRYVPRMQPDGTRVFDEIPLPLEGLLYPEEGDFVVQEPWHTQDLTYCYSVLSAWYTDHPDVVVLGDGRVDWGVPGIRPLGPDILVLFEVRHSLQQATFHLADEGGHPVLVVEIASPGTRPNDFGIKRDFYYQVGVQTYVIIDRGPQGEDPIRLIGFQRAPTGWVPLAADAQGRVSLAPVGLLLGIEEERPWLYDAVTGERQPDRPEWRQALIEARARTQEAETQLQNVETQLQEVERRAAEAEHRLQDEARARLALEAQLRALQERLQQGTDNAD